MNVMYSREPPHRAAATAAHEFKKGRDHMKGVIYARYSSDNQREESIEGQLRECMEYAERNGITVFPTTLTGPCPPRQTTVRSSSV